MSAKPTKPKILFGVAASELSSSSEFTDVSEQPSAPSSVESWGPAARGYLSHNYNARQHPWIARVLKQIDAELLDVGTDDQSRVALGIETRLASGYLKRQLASPWLFSLEALNTFCEYNWPSYQKIDAQQVWPRTWFWETKPARGVRPRRSDSFAERPLGS